MYKATNLLAGLGHAGFVFHLLINVKARALIFGLVAGHTRLVVMAYGLGKVFSYIFNQSLAKGETPKLRYSAHSSSSSFDRISLTSILGMAIQDDGMGRNPIGVSGPDPVVWEFVRLL